MHFLACVLALFVALATAQQNAINVPPGGLQVAANTPVTLTWTNPSSGTITIKLQQGSVMTADTGLTVVGKLHSGCCSSSRLTRNSRRRGIRIDIDFHYPRKPGKHGTIQLRDRGRHQSKQLQLLTRLHSLWRHWIWNDDGRHRKCNSNQHRPEKHQPNEH